VASRLFSHVIRNRPRIREALFSSRSRGIYVKRDKLARIEWLESHQRESDSIVLVAGVRIHRQKLINEPVRIRGRVAVEGARLEEGHFV
jgi:hypothetical protein